MGNACLGKWELSVGEGVVLLTSYPFVLSEYVFLPQICVILQFTKSKYIGKQLMKNMSLLRININYS